ncbi:hypothetical protein YC2023_013790 [Brassica napus]
MSPISLMSPLSLTSKMDFNPFQDSANFVELLHSQQNVVFGSQGRVPLSSSQVPSFGSEAVELPAERKERRTWTVTEDIVFISSWLKTSKDPVVGNEQKSATFWTRVAAYFSASLKLAGYEKRDGNQCKQRWHKLNEAVCKFSGAYEAATREKTSGMNDNECSRYHIAVEDSSITGHSIISVCHRLYQFVSKTNSRSKGVCLWIAFMFFIGTPFKDLTYQPQPCIASSQTLGKHSAVTCTLTN